MSSNFENIANLSNLKSEFTFKELKKNCISRGLEFEKALSYDFPNLSNWLLKNAHVKETEELLDLYDDWLEAKLRADGNDYLVHPSLRFRYMGSKDEDSDEEKPIKKEKEKVVKVKREKDVSGLYKGTKKQYTFDLQRNGKTIDQVLTKVIRKFPDAKEKSIKIWFNRSRKENA